MQHDDRPAWPGDEEDTHDHAPPTARAPRMADIAQLAQEPPEAWLDERRLAALMHAAHEDIQRQIAASSSTLPAGLA